MLFEKKTLFGPLVFWFTGWSAVSPGHRPFCARASISVPGAPASSLVTGSQVLVSNPGVEICAPVCVAIALLCTAQPADPRFATSLAPVSDAEPAPTSALLTGAAGPYGEAGVDGLAWAIDAMHSSAAAETTTVVQLAADSRMDRLMAGNSCPAAPLP
jgi:hypothetical protein